MKNRKYIRPTTCIVKLRTLHILAVSDQSFSLGEAKRGGNASSAASRGGSGWDDDE